MQCARQLGLICFSSPFDESAVDSLEELDVPAYKIASFENNHLPLITKAASTGKPLIISTGMATLGELEQAVNTAREACCQDLILLKCTSTYPANTNIRTIAHLRELFGCQVGISDQTLGLGVAVASIALGATIVEKHFTLSRADGGVDSDFSLEPKDLSALVKETERAWLALGNIKYGLTGSELKNVIFLRSVYVAEDIAVGEIFTIRNIRIVRPGDGALPAFYDKLLGIHARRSYVRGTPLGIDELF